jgi:hypothetical protein
VLVRSPDQGDVRVKLNDSTAITVDGRMGKADDIKPGANVRASYQLIDGQPTASKLEVTNRSGTSSGMSSGSGSTGSSGSTTSTNPNTSSTDSSSSSSTGNSSSGDTSSTTQQPK